MESENLVAALCYDFLLKKDKSLADVFKTKTNSVSVIAFVKKFRRIKSIWRSNLFLKMVFIKTSKKTCFKIFPCGGIFKYF
jgi:hypothetical protein